ncbi:MAG TPA: hypothetical protein VKR32_06380 [Puia sp.]|nr:hypothetical protein [Puia sp.]
MKKLLVIFLLTLVTKSAILAQTTVDLIPSGGYTFADRTGFGNSYSKVDGAGNLGGSIMFNVNRRFGVELQYSHMSTTTGLYYYGGVPISYGDLKADYIMLGFVPYLGDPNAPVRPFLGGLIGAGVFSPGVDGPSDTKFTLGAEFGADMYVTPRFGFRVKAQVMSPFDYGTGYYAGNDASGAPYAAQSNLFQFSLNAGVIIGLGRELPPAQRRVMYGRPRPRYYRPYPYY